MVKYDPQGAGREDRRLTRHVHLTDVVHHVDANEDALLVDTVQRDVRGRVQPDIGGQLAIVLVGVHEHPHVDEAHGLGVFGNQGRGVCDYFGLTKDVDGIWWAFPISEFITLIVAMLLFKRLYRKKIKPLDDPITD